MRRNRTNNPPLPTPMRKQILRTVVGLSMTMTFACGSREYSEPKEGVYRPTFKGVRDQILVPHCINCHSKLASYTEVKKLVVAGNASASGLYNEIESEKMPPYGRKVDEQAVIALKKWIESGANPDE